jgi:peptide/nickel transport system substrate-binding protein
MSSTQRQHLSAERLFSGLAATLLAFTLSACVAGGPKHIAPARTEEEPRLSANSPIQKCDRPAPGQFKTVTIGGAELRQGRYPQGKNGGTLQRSIIGADPHTFNYWQATDSTSRELSAMMFAGLVDIDYFNGRVVPALAENIEALPDHRTYITHLRKGLTWSDGKPITSADVAFTWNTIVKGGYGNSSLRDVTAVDGQSPTVTVVDNLTNKFVTAKPFVPFNKALNLPIAPRHIIAPLLQAKNGREAFNQLWSSESKPSQLVTSGPFVLSEFVGGQRVVFKKTQNYFGVAPSGNRLPYLDKIVFTIVTDVNTNLLKFRAKETDITMLRPRDAGDLVSSADQGNYKLYDFGPMVSSNFLTFNLNQRKDPVSGKPYVDPIKSAWFNDVNFRQAINHSMDRKAIVKNYLKGLGSEAFCGQVSSSPFYDGKLRPFPEDLRLARALLSKSGFKWDASGNLCDRGGHRVEFDLLTGAGSPYWTFVGNAFSEDMKKLGIKVNYGELNFNTLSDKLSHSLDWQAVLFSLSGGDPLEPNDSANVYMSDGRLHLFDQRLPDARGKVIVTDARPWEKEIDELMARGPQTFDPVERKAVYNKVDEILYRESPFIYTATGTFIVGARNTLQNYNPTPLSQQTLGLHNIEEIWLK